MPRPYSNSLSSPVFTHYDRTQSSFRFQYWLLTIITFSEIAVVVAITVITLNCYFSCFKRNSFGLYYRYYHLHITTFPAHWIPLGQVQTRTILSILGSPGYFLLVSFSFHSVLLE